MSHSVKVRNTIKVRNIVIGEGFPKICVPITGVTRDEILDEARVVTGLPADLAEWRADWYEDIEEPGMLENTLHELRLILGEMPLIMTLRTSGEGGRISIGPGAYSDLIQRAIQTGCADIVDAEAFIDADGNASHMIIESAHKTGVAVISSFHDFTGTPGKEELVHRMRQMQALGADIVKIAVMPHSENDVNVLIDAASEMTSNYATRPIVAISMGELGAVTRIKGHLCGSSITFASATRSSAPGQIDAEELKRLMLDFV